MIKTILVPSLNSTCSPNALKLSLQVARLFGGHIECLHVHPDERELARYTASLDVQSGMFSDQIWEALVDGDKARASRSRNIFDDFCTTELLNGAPTDKSDVTAEWREVDGNNRDRTIVQAHYNDLIVFGRPTPPDDLTSSEFGDVLVGCGRPLLLAPMHTCNSPISTIVIAWKDSATAARAVTAAMPLLANAKKIHILGISESDETTQRNIESTESLAEHLRWHGLKPQTGHIKAGERNAYEVLLEAAEKLHGGLLVMGAYGHSRAREFVFGGFSRRVLQSAPVPVFLCH